MLPIRIILFSLFHKCLTSFSLIWTPTKYIHTEAHNDNLVSSISSNILNLWATRQVLNQNTKFQMILITRNLTTRNVRRKNYSISLHFSLVQIFVQRPLRAIFLHSQERLCFTSLLLALCPPRVSWCRDCRC